MTGKTKSKRETEQGVSRRRNDGTKGDLLKNGVVKHSTHIVSYLSTLLSRVPPVARSRTYSPMLFNPFLFRLHSGGKQQGERGEGRGRRRFLIFARFSYRQKGTPLWPLRRIARRRILANGIMRPGLGWIFLEETGYNSLASPLRGMLLPYIVCKACRKMLGAR